MSEISNSSDVLVNVSACIFSDIPTLLRRLELHRQLTHQPNCDRIFSKPLPLQLLCCFLRTCKCRELLRSFDDIFKLAHINNLQTENAQDSLSTSKDKRLTILRTRQFLTQVMQDHFSWHRAIALLKRKEILRVLLKMVAIATSHSLWRFYLIALTPTIPALLQKKIRFSNKHILWVSVLFYSLN